MCFDFFVGGLIPPRVKPPTPTWAARPPTTVKFMASSLEYTSRHLAPGPMRVLAWSCETTIWLSLAKSMVIP